MHRQLPLEGPLPVLNLTDLLLSLLLHTAPPSVLARQLLNAIRGPPPTEAALSSSFNFHACSTALDSSAMLLALAVCGSRRWRYAQKRSIAWTSGELRAAFASLTAWTKTTSGASASAAHSTAVQELEQWRRTTVTSLATVTQSLILPKEQATQVEALVMQWLNTKDSGARRLVHALVSAWQPGLVLVR